MLQELNNPTPIYLDLTTYMLLTENVIKSEFNCIFFYFQQFHTVPENVHKTVTKNKHLCKLDTNT